MIIKELGEAELASIEYIKGRKKYGRPQAILFANNPGTVVLDEDIVSPTFGQYFHVPLGSEVRAEIIDPSGNEFLILSDDNRQPIDIASQRIEKRERMVNGRMRSYHIADKVAISTAWENLPSRAFSEDPEFGLDGRPTSSPEQKWITDGGAGAADLVDWYERYTGSFWVYLAYDKLSGSGDYGSMSKYNQVIEVMFSDFSHSISKRGTFTHDFWNVSLNLEEV